MTLFNQTSPQIPAISVQKPTPVTVFGVFNIIIAVSKLAVNIPGLIRRIIIFEMLNSFDEKAFLFYLTVMTGLYIWLFVLGTGLLTMKRWARRGCCMYARIQILLIIIMLVILTFSSVFHSTNDRVTHALYQFFTMWSIQLDSLIYPVLLLIFMKTSDVRKAFEAVEKKADSV